jgi:hypothetical protein
LITAMQGRATNVLHGVPKRATYEEILKALEKDFGNQYLAAAYWSQLKQGPRVSEIPWEILPQLSNSWATAATPHYPRIS